MLFERGVSHRSEGRVVHALELPLGIELVHASEDVAVGLVGGTDDELRGLADGTASALLGELVNPGHGVEDVFLEVLHGAELVHVLLGGCLDVDGQPSAEPVGGLDVLVLGAGHHLHVDVALEAVLVADGVHHLDQALRGLGSVASDAGAEEEAADRLPSLELHEGAGELVHLEGVALSWDPVAVGAVCAVHLAEVGEHDAHEVDKLAVGHGGAVHAVGRVLFGRGIGATAVAASFGRRQDVVGGHSAEYPELVVCIG